MFNYCKSIAVRWLPPKMVTSLRGLVRRLRGRYIANLNSDKSSKDVFSEIYEKNLWGGKVGTFYSGSEISDIPAGLYIDVVRNFMRDREVRSVVDLGCGDFKIGRQISEACESYVGVDVVPALIEHLRDEYSSSRVSFACLDASLDDLPSGDLCLIRQVLQHLSNEQISRILKKLSTFKYLIVTEHYPNDSNFRSFNMDKVHGRDTRLDYGSAVYLQNPPFNVGSQTLLLQTQPSIKPGDVHDVYRSGFLRTYLVDL